MFLNVSRVNHFIITAQPVQSEQSSHNQAATKSSSVSFSPGILHNSQDDDKNRQELQHQISNFSYSI